FTIAGLLVVGFVLTAMSFLLERRPANAYLTVFLAASLGSPLLFVSQRDVGLAMAVVALACAVPAYRLALSDDGDDDGRGGTRRPPDPPAGSGPDLWTEFEREFWSHVDRTRDLVRLIARRLVDRAGVGSGVGALAQAGPARRSPRLALRPA
ncbi:MAG TPA: hypothetical protein VHW26_12340, partial [Solirubrobacteraceae bacterium]|nr:hypothetical protein [Solirubrobacteraceae bacterium]